MPVSYCAKILCALIILLIICTSSNAQKFNVQFSDKIQSASGYFTEGSFLKALPSSQEEFLTLFIKRKNKIVIGVQPLVTYSLIKFDKNLSQVKEIVLDDLLQERSDLLDVIKLGDNYFILTEEFSKSDKSLTVFAYSIDVKKMTTGQVKVLGTFDMSKDEKKISGFGNGVFSDYDLRLTFSNDSSTFCVSYFPQVKKNSNKEIQFYVFDKTLNRVISKNYDFDIPEKKLELNSFNIDNSGNVYLFYDLFDEKDTKDYKNEYGEKVPAYTSHLLIFKSKSTSDISINNEKNYIKKIKLGLNTAEEVVLFGLYKKTYKGNYAGICRSTLKDLLPTGKQLSFTYNDFPQGILDKLDNDGQAKKEGNDKGIDLDFDIMQGILLSDGSTHLILEYLNEKRKAVEGGMYTRIYGDIIVTTVNNDGKFKFACVPKLQKFVYFFSDLQYLRYSPVKLLNYSFQAVYLKDQLLLFYNDDEENIGQDVSKKPEEMSNAKKSVFTCAALKSDGDLLTRSAILKSADFDGYATGTDFFELAPGTYAIFSTKIGGFRYSVKVGKLTIQ